MQLKFFQNAVKMDFDQDHIEQTSSKSDMDPKNVISHLEEVNERAPNADRPKQRQEAPPQIQMMSTEERHRLEKSLVRKIDIRLLPAVIIMYIMNYLDRNNIATARLAGNPGLQKDLDMSDTQYETCVSILFVGYILMQIPSNLFLNKVGKPGIYLPAVMTVWGIISAATAAAQTFSGLVAIRFFLGFVEAAYFPGCLYYLSCWYTRKELAFRTAILYSGSLLSGAFAGLIGAGITHGLNGSLGIPAWRWLFIIEGCITVVVAALAFLVLPNFPRTTKWLSEEERQLAIWRLQEDVGIDDWTGSEDQSFWQGMRLAFRDIKMWILMFMLFGLVSSGSVTTFFPSVVQTLGYGNIDTLLLTAPPYVLAVITTYLNAAHADRTGERFFHVVIPLFFALAAFILAAATTSTAPRYVAMMLMIPGIYTGYVVILAWISNTIPRPPSKRAASLAAINAVSNIASIYASYMYSGAPRYIVAFSVNCGTVVLAIILATVLRFILVRLNRKLDRGEQVEGAVGGDIAAGEGEAMKRGFRFLI